MSHHAPTPLQEQKQRLRDEMREKRRLTQSNNYSYFNKLAEVFQKNITLPPNAVVASYCAFRNEMDPATLSEALRGQGHPIALPVITGKREALIFRLYEQGDMLLANPMGIFEPASAAQGVEPDVLLVPLLAFDSQRNRLGYGGGFYDRTITRLRTHKPVLTIGVAYAYQQIERVPTGPNDIPLDRIVTELDAF